MNRTTLVASVAAVGLAGTAYVIEGPKDLSAYTTTIPELEKVREDTNGIADPADNIQFCFPSAGGPRQCTTRAVLLSGKGGARVNEMVNQISGEGPEEMVLSHPTDFKAAKRKVSDCDDFNAMKQEGWGAVSSADMSDEAFFEQRCGLMKMAEKAALVDGSEFISGRLTSDDFRAVPSSDWPRLGDVQTGTLEEVTPVQDGVWTVYAGDAVTVVTEISHADFTGDGQGDVLVFMLGAPAEGTARIAKYGLILKGEDSTRLIAPKIY